MVGAVKRGYGLALFGIADDYFVPAYIVVVKGVHWLTRFKHYKVCNINNIVNGAHTRGGYGFFHPLGRLLYAQVFNHPAYIAGAQVKIAHFNAYIIRYILSHRFIFRLGRFKFGAQHYRNFLCNAQKAVAIGTVGGNFKVYYIIVKPQNLAHVGARLRLAL